mgnify:CR=1 FL=1
MGNDDTVYDYPLESGRLSNRYIRNTNATKVYDQLDTGTCYAHSAASAYINTILRIYGHKPPPTMEECFRIACYNGDKKGGDPEKSIRLLEEHFNYGILCESTYYNPTIRETMTISIILSFTTSKQGWRDVSNGSLLERADGIQTVDWHASLIEGYDFDHDCCVCKNSWGENTASGRFNILLQKVFVGKHQNLFQHYIRYHLHSQIIMPFLWIKKLQLIRVNMSAKYANMILIWRTFHMVVNILAMILINGLKHI